MARGPYSRSLFYVHPLANVPSPPLTSAPTLPSSPFLLPSACIARRTHPLPLPTKPDLHAFSEGREREDRERESCAKCRLKRRTHSAATTCHTEPSWIRLRCWLPPSFRAFTLCLLSLLCVELESLLQGRRGGRSYTTYSKKRSILNRRKEGLSFFPLLLLYLPLPKLVLLCCCCCRC